MTFWALFGNFYCPILCIKYSSGSFDSLDEESGGYLDRAGNNKMDTQSDSSSFSTDPLSDDTSFKASQVSSFSTDPL